MYLTCRKVLAGLRTTQFELNVVPNNPPADGDLYIWDYEADPSLKGSELVARKANIFLVEKENLSALRSHFAVPPVWTLLKPVNPQLLESFVSDPSLLAESAANHGHGNPASAHRDDLLEALLEANLFMQQSDQARNDMFSQGTRELRPPLMATLGYCRLLLDQQLGALNADQLKVIQRMQQSTQRVLRLATSMFQATVGPTGPMQARFQPGNFLDCVDTAVREITAFLEARNLTIQRSILPPKPGFLFDPDQITHLLANLLDHAVRFTPRGGEIRLRMQPVFWDRRAKNLLEERIVPERRVRRAAEPNAYRIEVQDPGPAIRQTQDSSNVNGDGLSGTGSAVSDNGFGLAICQQIIDMHRGRIVFDGVESGYFALEIPYAQELDSEIRTVRSDPGRSLRARVS